MAATVAIIDEVTGGGRTERMRLRLASERITARELIERRIRDEVAAYNEKQQEHFRGLVQPSDTEATLNGYRLRTRRTLDADEQCALALRAFEHNGFVLLVDDRQVEELDDELTLVDGSEVTFLKLVPLVGG